MSTQTCPYCGIVFSLDGVDQDCAYPHFQNMARSMFGASSPPKRHGQTVEPKKNYRITSHRCPQCQNDIMWLTEMLNRRSPSTQEWESEDGNTTLLFPKRRHRIIPAEIPEPYASEFLEAYYTLEVSPKASAALSRRCLQMLIREQENIQERTLFDEVSKLIATNKLPQHLADDLDAIRNVGNFAAHPLKDTATDAIVPVEPAEAEWTLSILEQILAFYFVQLPASKARRDALNQKLKATGQKPML